LELGLDALTVCDRQATVPVLASLAIQLLDVVRWANLTIVANPRSAGSSTLFTTLEHEERHVDRASGDGKRVSVVCRVEMNLDVPGAVSELEPGHQNFALQL
jgi:hypothetical protein